MPQGRALALEAPLASVLGCGPTGPLRSPGLALQAVPLSPPVDDEALLSPSRPATTPSGRRTDAYFDNAGQELLAQLLLAAAEGQKPISTVFTWLADSEDDTPVGLLRQAGHTMSSDALRATINLPEKQKAYLPLQTPTWLVANKMPDRGAMVDLTGSPRPSRSCGA